jgi:hypothetical protein
MVELFEPPANGFTKVQGVLYNGGHEGKVVVEIHIFNTCGDSRQRLFTPREDRHNEEE